MTPSLLPLRGREAELGAIADQLRSATGGQGAIVLVEGPPGIGKSRLLAEALPTARRLGVKGALGAAEEVDRVVPLAPLLGALFEGDDPLLERSALRDLSRLPDQRFWMLQELQGVLEEAALEQPLLVAVDDVQWADAATLSALRALPARLTSHAIVWLLAYRSGTGTAAFRDTLTALTEAGARHVRLEPLSPAPVEEIVADVLGGSVAPAVLRLAARAQGNPFVLVELLHGLSEEGLVRAVDGRIELVQDDRLPDRFGQSMSDRLDRLSDPARDAVKVASVLGRRFSVQDLAGLLRRSPGALLGSVQESFDADLLREDGAKLAFRHDLIREAVHDVLPGSVRDALHRHAADVLLARGASPVEAASHLAESAQPGDRGAIETLRSAARELAQSAPSSAADFSLRALELTPDGDEAQGALRAETISLLVQAGRATEAKAAADVALDGLLGPEDEARVRLSLAQLLAQYTSAGGVEQCRRGLALEGVSPELRADLMAMLAHALTLSGRTADAAPAAMTALEASRAAGRDAAEVSALVDLSLAEYLRHRWQPALDLVDEAVAVAEAGSPEARALAIPEVWRCLLWASLDRIDDALRVAETEAQDAQRDGRASALRLWMLTRCRLLYDAGRLADAGAEAEALLAMEGDLGTGNLGEAVARHVLTRVAVRAGERRQARAALGAAQHLVDSPSVMLQAICRTAAGVVAEAEGELETAMEILTPSYEALDADDDVLGALNESGDGPWLVRLAVRAGEPERAHVAVRAAERRAARNPGVASLEASAAHSRALLEDDLDALRRAVECYRECARPLGRASALEDLGKLAPRAEAVGHLDEALRVYIECGAVGDAVRVRRRLRALGVRRRRVAPVRPSHGWEALTESELGVVRVIAGGATNREAAEQLFLSPHTVSSHLRHAFAKLGINSRVELARIVVEAEREPAAAPRAVPSRRPSLALAHGSD